MATVGTRRTAGAIGGALAAGGLLSTMLLAGERKTGTPSELADLYRAGGRRVGARVAPPDQVPDMGEQGAIHGIHLGLSVAAGAAYAATFDEDSSVLVSGAAFGLGFYALMHWVVGPALGLKAPEWDSGGKVMGLHAANHVGFGIVTALGAKLAGR